MISVFPNFTKSNHYNHYANHYRSLWAWWDAYGAAPGKPEPKEFDYTFYLVIVTIFMCGTLLGGVIGYLIAYIKYQNKSLRAGRGAASSVVPPAVEEDLEPVHIDTGATHHHVPTTVMPPPRRGRSAETAPRNWMPGQIVITKTGLEETHIFHREGCHVTRAGAANRSNVTFRKCDICFYVDGEPC